MRRPIIAGNWKMNMLISNADEWVGELLDNLHLTNSVDLIIAPPFTALALVRERTKGSKIKLAGQNIGSELEGARTGEISAAMLKDAGCDYVILGHSERRQYFAETDELVNRKISIACDQGLNIIFCIGESLAERRDDLTNKIIERQLSIGLSDLDAMNFGQLVIAYEPIWAIGTGQNASPEQVQDVHRFIRTWCEKSFGAKQAEATRIIYGGSVKPKTSASLMNQLDVDGLLVGGASLKFASFCDIIKASFKN